LSKQVSLKLYAYQGYALALRRFSNKNSGEDCSGFMVHLKSP
jgi:hypothetical protein